MDLDKLQDQWDDHYDNLTRSEDLAINLFKKAKYKKIDTNLNRMKKQSLFYMLFNLVVIVFSWLVLIENITVIGISFSAGLLILVSKIVFYKNVQQLNLISNINYSEPIVKLQKIIESLKLSRLRHNKFIFILSNMYFWLILIVLFSINPMVLIPEIWSNAAIVVVIHIGFSILWIPLAFWILSKYNFPSQNSLFWKKLGRNSLLTDESANTSLIKISSFLKELDDFEKEN